MPTVTGLTAERMLAIEGASVVSGDVNQTTGHLILTKYDTTTIDAGNVFSAGPDASTTVKGIAELATSAETITGTDTVRTVTPAGLAALVTALALPTTYQGLDTDLTAIAGLTPTNDDFVQRKSGVWVNRSVAQVSSDLNVGAALEDGTWLPRHQGLIAWSFDPAACSAGKATTAGVLYLTKVVVPKATTIVKVLFGVQTAGSGLTGGQNKAALYDSTGVRLSDADVSTAAASTGLVAATLVASQAVAAGAYWVGTLFNGTTPPQLWRGGDLTAALANAGISTTTNARFGTYGTGQTSAPTTLTLSSIAYAQGTTWAAVSA